MGCYEATVFTMRPLPKVLQPAFQRRLQERSVPQRERLNYLKWLRSYLDFYADLWLGFRRRIMNDKVNWKAQFNVRSVGQDAELDPIGTHLEGSTALYRIARCRFAR